MRFDATVLCHLNQYVCSIAIRFCKHLNHRAQHVENLRRIRRVGGIVVVLLRQCGLLPWCLDKLGSDRTDQAFLYWAMINEFTEGNHFQSFFVMHLSPLGTRFQSISYNYFGIMLACLKASLKGACSSVMTFVLTNRTSSRIRARLCIVSFALAQTAHCGATT